MQSFWKIVFCFLIGSFSELYSQSRLVGWVESENAVQKNITEPKMNIYLQSYSSHNSVELWAYSRISKSNMGIYSGFTLVPNRNSWIQLGLAYGLTSKPFLRELEDQYAAQVLAGSEDIQFISFYEDNLRNTDWWYKSTFTIKYAKNLRIGIHSERGLGTGPYGIWKLKSLNLEFWSSILTDSPTFKNPITWMLGLKLNSF
jgi:hypothetical protein